MSKLFLWYNMSKDFLINSDDVFQRAPTFYGTLEKAIEALPVIANSVSVIFDCGSQDTVGVLAYSFDEECNKVDITSTYDFNLLKSQLYGLEQGWSKEAVKNGYAIFESHIIPGALHIESIDDIGRFTSDDDAAQAAEKDGIKIIRDIALDPNSELYANYIDNPANRELITKYLESHKREVCYE